MEKYPEMKNIRRTLNMDIPQRKSAFLWGPRKVGKSSYLKDNFPNSLMFDFLKTDLSLELTKRPSLLREQILAKDKEILKHPIILDEVHWLIEIKV